MRKLEDNHRKLGSEQDNRKFRHETAILLNETGNSIRNCSNTIHKYTSLTVSGGPS